jgi:5'-3' exonuclease
MVDMDSPLYTYYPLDFDLDMNGKSKDWEAIVLIPYVFILLTTLIKEKKNVGSYEFNHVR